MKQIINVEITISVTMEIDTDIVGYGVTGGAEDPDDIVAEAVSYAVQELDYTMEVTEPGIKVLKTQLMSYSI